MSLGRMIRADDLVEIQRGKFRGQRGVVVKRTRFRGFTYARINLVNREVSVRVDGVAKITFEQLAREQSVDPFEIGWINRTPKDRLCPSFHCPLCDRLMLFQWKPETCPRCNWRKPSLLEKIAHAADA